MGEKTASQVQDVVVAGSQSSNFLLPKENKRLSAGPPPHPTHNGGPMLKLRPNKACRGCCPLCFSLGTWAGGEGGMLLPHTHTHTNTCSGLRSCVTVHLTSLGPRRSCRRWTESPEPPPPRPLLGSIFVLALIAVKINPVQL